jgi:transcription elongation factor Elf1
METESVFCHDCDREHECPIVRGEYEDDDYTDVPDACEACGASLVSLGEPSYREDFHADG